jgi:outer membrane receptor protein involved in Fe transport
VKRLLIAAGLLVVWPAAAQDSARSVARMDDIEEAPMEDLLGMNLEDRMGETGAVSKQSESVLRAPAALTTIDGSVVRLSGATTIAELLRWVPGVQVFRSAPGNYVVSIRGTGGLAGNNTILLVDGIPLNSPLDGGVDWDLIPINASDVERIEIVRGPVSPTYGANAYTGVINIVTRTTIGASPNYAGRVRVGADLDGGTTESVSGRFIHLTRKLEFRWFLDAERDKTFGTTSGFDHPALQRYGLFGVLGYSLSPTSKLSLQVGRVRSTRSSLDYLVLESEPQTRELLFARVQYQASALPGVFDSVKLWAQGTSQFIRANVADYEGFSYAGTDSSRGVAGLDLAFDLHPRFRATLGGQASVDHVRAPYLNPAANSGTRPGYGFYGGFQLSPLDRLDLGLSGRGDISAVTADLEFSYRAFAVYHADSWGIRLAAASAFREPTYVEAGGRFVDPASGLILLEGSPGIGAPRNTSVELGATLQPVSGLTLSPTVYFSRLTNVMVQDFEPLVRRTFLNDTEPRDLLGGELEATWNVSDAFSVSPSFSILYWLQANERVDTTVGVPDQNSTYVGGLRLHGVLADERFGYGLGGVVVSSREFNVRAGIPPRVLRRSIPTSGQITGLVEYELSRGPSTWVSLRARSSFPSDTAESPLPTAAPLGTSVMAGVELRNE